ncbi:MAG: ABC-F family ATP-binding cassette domain-containing protein [Planctomycetota bacterium]
MTLASLERIERRFGDFEVLTGASLRIDEKERVGIVGDNGSGKTTLIRILAGVDEPDRGERNLRRNLRIAYAEQVPKIEPGTTIRDYVLRGDGTFDRLEAEVRALEQALAADPHEERLLREYGELQGRFEAAGGYDRTHVCERVLSGIGFAEHEWQKDAAVLSGGEKSRLVLAALMTSPADLLILDEPTNHLDLEGIAFVEDHVRRYPGAVVVISHDRRFLNAGVTRIVEVDDGATTSWPGNYDAWRKLKDERLLAEARQFKSEQAYFEKEMEYIRRNNAGRMARQAKGRLRKLQRLAFVSRPKGEKSGMRLQFADKVRGQSGQTILEGIDLTLRIGERTLVADSSFRIVHGECMGLVGRNGTGKSTLLRAIAGRHPLAKGEIRRAHGIQIGTFSQDVTDLPHGRTVLDALRMLDPEATEKELRDHLALFLFSGDDVEAPVDGLSGGEKQRLSLARLTRSHHDMLCLDEPTNHLDVAGREGLEQAIAEFPGAGLLITHDRQLLASASNRILALENQRLRTFDGGFDAFVRAAADATPARRTETTAAQSAKPSAPTSSAAPTKIRNPMMFQKLEEQIFALEEELESVRTAMTQEENYLDAARMRDLQEREAKLDAELTAAYERWENWNEG